MNKKATSPMKLYVGMAGMKLADAAPLVLFPLLPTFVPILPGSSTDRQV
jgi:hypothetical protein